VEEAAQLLLFVMVCIYRKFSTIRLVLTEHCVDTPQETIENAVKELASYGFECYETSVGGPGVGISLLEPEWNAATLCSATRSELEAVKEWRWM
jgi:hypothetical protein